MAAAKADPGIEAMHDWRKRAKDFWYQARLLTPVWPEAIGPLATTAADLTEELGRHHDLAVLADHAAALPPDHAAAEATLPLHALIRAAQAEIERQAFPQGARLFAGEPKAMADLWVAWWRAWHD
jgi:CHAD domain-containing protein